MMLKGILYLFVLVLLVLLFIEFTRYEGINLLGFLNTSRQTGIPYVNYTASTSVTEQQNYTTSVPPNATSLDTYALYLINKDRSQYGLQNVTLSSEPSAQQHSQSMLAGDYFSHWDTYGLKPYMRYTLLGGGGAVSENVAFLQSGVESCIASFCTTRGNIDPANALQQMEYSMMYNDSICCNNGHRDNILDPNHNQVSIGIAYNASTIYFTEDFIDNYIDWQDGYPNYINGTVSLAGTKSMQIANIEIGYDPTPVQMSPAQLDNTTDYSYGQTIGGVVSNNFAYYPGLTTIVASRYDTSGNDLNVQFNMHSLTQKYGAGVYTIEIWMNGTSGSFVGSTYSIFINGNGNSYTPSNI